MFRTSSIHQQERFLQAVFADLVCGNTRTTRHVQPLLRNGWTCRVVRVYLVGMRIYYLSLFHGFVGTTICSITSQKHLRLNTTVSFLEVSRLCTTAFCTRSILLLQNVLHESSLSRRKLHWWSLVSLSAYWRTELTLTEQWWIKVCTR